MAVLDLCIDWLRYITAPEQASLIIAELGQFLPNIKGVEVNEDLQARSRRYLPALARPA